MAKQVKAKNTKKQVDPFEPRKTVKKVNMTLNKRGGSIFEASKGTGYEEKDQWAEDHDELGETEEQTEDEMETGKAQADPYSKSGRKVLEDDEEEIEPWEEAWSAGASGKGAAGRYEEGRSASSSKKVKDTVKGLKKKKK